MPLRPRPLPHAADRLVDLQDPRPDVTEVRIRLASAEVLKQRILHLLRVVLHHLAQFAELLDPPLDR